MVVYKGKSIRGGVAMGKISVYSKDKLHIGHKIIRNTEEEVKRFLSAQQKAILHFEDLYQKTLVELGEVNAAIFDVYKLLLEDESFVEEIVRLICTEKLNAEYAIIKAKNNMISSFIKYEDNYLRERALDIEDVSERLIGELCGEKMFCYCEEEPIILLGENLTPSEVMQLDRRYIQALVLIGGSQYSHTAILTGNWGIPVLLCEVGSLEDIEDGKSGALDGEKGLLFIEPEEKVLKELKEKQEKDKVAAKEHRFPTNQKFAGDISLKLCVNISSLNELQQVKESDADGIGLLRTEFVFMETNTLPTEEEQFQIYCKVLETMGDKEVIIRTLDVGADKSYSCFAQYREENPALGLRGIRVSLKNKKIFKDQIKALFRASVYGELCILYPMITSLEEVRSIKALVEEAKEELEREGCAYGNPRQGIMIETPAAVMISDMLAKEVDFFSIGTNDLTQYTLAMDRQSSMLSEYYNPYHPSVLRMIELVIKNAHNQGIKVAVCGELSADLEMTEWFIQSGVDELSVAPGKLLPLKTKLMKRIP